jgi:formate dehydrogenase maturation protein FdhE
MHQDLINLVVEGEEAKQRAVACERCRCYVKQISTLVPIPAPQLLAADLATLHLDLAAMERAYAPPQ